MRVSAIIICLHAICAITALGQADVLLEPDAMASPKYPWKTDIVGTIFWVGEQAGQNNPVPNTKSSWDTRWAMNFGGVDDPNKRAAEFHPAGFVPMQNPFYVALPYNDIRGSSDTKDDAAKIIPWFKEAFEKEGRSVCHNRWIAIHHGGRVCFAQWSDCGPFTTSDGAYVFGDSRPSNTRNGGAGIDLSPAVRDFLGFRSGDRCDWRFVDEGEVAEGPWRHYGTNNPFAPAKRAPEPRDDRVITATFSVSTSRPVPRAKGESKPAVRQTSEKAKLSRQKGSSRLEELKRLRDEWFAGK